MFRELRVRVLEESSLRGSRVETVRTLVLMLSRRDVDENWCLKSSIYSEWNLRDSSFFLMRSSSYLTLVSS